MELSYLMPPADLVVQNGIGVGRPDDVAVEFDEIGHGLVAELVRDALYPHHRVLDAGCGLGRLARALVDYLSPEGSYEGIDVTRSSIEWCQNAYKGIPRFKFTHADVFNTHYNSHATKRASTYRFPFPDDDFDYIFSTSLFTHLMLPDADNYIGQMARVLKQGGKCGTLFSCWTRFLSHLLEPLRIQTSE